MMRPSDWIVNACSLRQSAVFSPAPTLLELQQESMSQRLKTYKSLHGLTAATNDSSKLKDKAPSNGKHFPCPLANRNRMTNLSAVSAADELSSLCALEASSNLSGSNSSLTSLRSLPSPKSVRDFNDDDTSNSLTDAIQKSLERTEQEAFNDDGKPTAASLCIESPAKKTVSGSEADAGADNDAATENVTSNNSAARAEDVNMSPNENTSR